MSKKISVTKAVDETLVVFGFISLPLALGVINYSAMARRIRPTIEEKLQRKVTQGAITIAIQRAAAKLSSDRGTMALVDAVSKTKTRISTGQGVAFFRNTPLTRLEISRTFAESASRDSSSNFRLLSRAEDIVVISSEENCQKLIKAVQRKSPGEGEFVGRKAVITLLMPKLALGTAGYLNFFLNELTYHGINLLQVFTTRTGISFVIDDADAALAYDRLNYMISTCRNRLATPFPMGK